MLRKIKSKAFAKRGKLQNPKVADMPPEKWQVSLDTNYNGKIVCNVDLLRYQYCKKSEDGRGLLAGRDVEIRHFYEWMAVNAAPCDTKYNLFNFIKTILCWTDKYKIDIWSAIGATKYLQHLQYKTRTGCISENSAAQYWSSYKKILNIYNLPVNDYIGLYCPFTYRGNRHKTLPYSDSERKRVIQLLYKIFWSLHHHYLNSYNKPVVKINYSEKIITLFDSGATKSSILYYKRCLSVTAYYIVAYMTGLNASVLMRATCDNFIEQTEKNGHTIYVLELTKPRANYKRVKGYFFGKLQALFIKTWLQIAKQLNSNSNWLFPVLYKDHFCRRVNAGDCSNYKTLIHRNFQLFDDAGKLLHINASRLRQNIATIAKRVTGSTISSAQFLGHTPQVSDAYYNNVEAIEGYAQNQAALHTLSHVTTKHLSIVEAKLETAKQMGIEVLPYSELQKRYPASYKTLVGGRCKRFSGELASTRKNKDSSNDISCLNNNKCLFCPSFILVDTTEDAYLLLSYRETILQQIPKHEDYYHYKKNFSILEQRINNVLALFSSTNLKRAKAKLNNDLHPWWKRLAAICK